MPAWGPAAAAPLRVAVLCSGRAPGLRTLLARGRHPAPPYRVVGCVSSDPGCREVGLLARHGVPFRAVDIHRFYAEGEAPVGDLELRRAYDGGLLEILEGYGADAVLLCGYLYVVTAVLLDAFPGRVYNIHHSDLTRTDADGRPRFRGLRAVRDAIRAGERETRSTVHLATDRVDEGPVVARSEPFPVHPMADLARERGREDLLRAYAYAHREWMMETSWGPLLDRALGMVARERAGASTTGGVA